MANRRDSNNRHHKVNPGGLYKQNEVYSKFVDDDEDAIGLIAYALFERRIIKYTDEYSNQHRQFPDNRDIETIKNSLNKDEIALYKERALNLVTKLVIQSANATIFDNVSKATTELSEKLKQGKSLKKSWYKRLSESISDKIGKIFTGLLIAVIAPALLGFIYTKNSDNKDSSTSTENEVQVNTKTDSTKNITNNVKTFNKNKS